MDWKNNTNIGDHTKPSQIMENVNPNPLFLESLENEIITEDIQNSELNPDQKISHTNDTFSNEIVSRTQTYDITAAPFVAAYPKLHRQSSDIESIISKKLIPDFNVYQQKKTLAQGMMDLALLAANASQLRYVLDNYNRHPYYYPSLTFICISLVLQVATGVLLILNARYNVKDSEQVWSANKVNNYTVIGIFLVLVMNVLISAFTITYPSDITN